MFGSNVSYQFQPRDFAAPTTVWAGVALEVIPATRILGHPLWEVGLYGALSNLLVNGEFIGGHLPHSLSRTDRSERFLPDGDRRRESYSHPENRPTWDPGSGSRSTRGRRARPSISFRFASVASTKAKKMEGASIRRSVWGSIRTMWRSMPRGHWTMILRSSTSPMGRSPFVFPFQSRQPPFCLRSERWNRD